MDRRRQSPAKPERRKERVEPEAFVTSEVHEERVFRGIREGARLVWKTTLINLLTIIIVVLLIVLFLFPESRNQVLKLLQDLVGALKHLLFVMV